MKNTQNVGQRDSPNTEQVRGGQVELRHLRYFLAVARLLNFRQAAQELGIAQPVLSNQVAALEAIVGARLFDRTSRSVALSQAGQIFVREAELTIRQAERAQRIVERAGRGDVGTLHLAYAGSTLYTGLMSSAVFKYRQRCPEVEINLVELGIEEQIAAIEDGSLDIGLLRLPLPDGPHDVETKTILLEPIVMAIRQDHPLAAQPSIAVADFRNEHLISSVPRHVGILKQVLDATASLGFTPTVIAAQHFGAIISLVSAGFGMAMVPKSAATIKLPQVTYRPITGLAPSEVALVYRKGGYEPTVNAFLKLSKEPGV